MNYLDIFIVAALVWGGYKGFKKGFIYEVFTFLALFLGLYAGIHFSDYTTSLLRSNGAEEGDYLPIISFAITFCIVGATVHFAGKALTKVIKVVQLSLVNRLLGLGIGVLKFAFFVGGVIMILESYDQRKDILTQETKESSLLFHPIQGLVRTTIPAFNESTLFLKDVLMEENTEEIINEI